MNEVIIFCESYTQIKCALYVTTQNEQQHHVTIVIPGNRDLSKFFELLNEKVFHGKLNVIYFDAYRGRIDQVGSRAKKAFFIFPEIAKERHYLKSIFQKYFARLKGAEVFFFTRCFNPSSYFLLSQLCATNNLVYMPDPIFDVVRIPSAAPTSLFELAQLVRIKLVYGQDMSLGEHSIAHKIPRINDRFIIENVTRIVEGKERDSMLQNFEMSQLKVVDNGNYSLLYFHDSLVETDYVIDAQSFQTILNDIFDIVRKYFPVKNVAIKYHPGYPDNKTGLPFGELLSAFIPAEFLFHDKVKIYLSVASQTLANVEKGVAVSLVDMISFKNENIKKQLKQTLIQSSHSEILFPQSLDEFEGILAKLE